MIRIALAAILSMYVLPGAATAQETAASGLQANDAQATEAQADGAGADPIDRWLEDPTLIFEADEIDLENFVWRARPLVVFGDSPFDPNFQRQMQLIEAGMEELAERDVLVVVDTDPGTPSELRTRLRPRGFMLALVGKNGDVSLRKPLPWSVRELTRSIDKTPLRQQEIEDRRGG